MTSSCRFGDIPRFVGPPAINAHNCSSVHGGDVLRPLVEVITENGGEGPFPLGLGDHATDMLSVFHTARLLASEMTGRNWIVLWDPTLGEFEEKIDYVNRRLTLPSMYLTYDPINFARVFVHEAAHVLGGDYAFRVRGPRGQLLLVVDIVHIHRSHLHLAALAWAGTGKDPGLSPEAIIQWATRNSVHRPEDLAALSLVRLPSLQELRQR